MGVYKIVANETGGQDAGLQKNTVSLMMETVPLITRKLTRKFAKGGYAHGPLPPLLVFALMVIGEQGPVSMGELARHMQVPKQNATHIVDRLTAQGLVERQPDPDDRRSIRVSLNEKGREHLCAMQAQTAERIGEFLSTLSGEQQQELYNAILALNVFFKKL